MNRRLAIATLFWHHRRERWDQFHIARGRFVWPGFPEEMPTWPCL